MYKSFACLLAVVSAVVAAPALQARAPPAGFAITSVSQSGAGCPSGSTVSVLNGDKTAFSSAFSEFFAQSVGGASGSASCTTSVAVSVPAGYRAGITKIAQRGYAQVDSGATTTRSSIYAFQGVSNTASSSTVRTGIFEGSFSSEDLYDASTSILSTCGEDTVLTITTDVDTVTPSSSATGYGAVDSLDGHLFWAAC